MASTVTSEKPWRTQGRVRERERRIDGLHPLRIEAPVTQEPDRYVAPRMGQLHFANNHPVLVSKKWEAGQVRE